YPTGVPKSPQGPCTAAPVGTAVSGASRWGHLDVAGDVSVWHLDHQYWRASLDMSQDAQPSYVNPCVDCACLKPASDAAVPRRSRAYSAVRFVSPSPLPLRNKRSKPQLSRAASTRARVIERTGAPRRYATTLRGSLHAATATQRKSCCESDRARYGPGRGAWPF